MRQRHLHRCGTTLALLKVIALSQSTVAQTVLPASALDAKSRNDESAILEAARVVMELSTSDVQYTRPNISPQAAEFIRWTTTWDLVRGSLRMSRSGPLEPATLSHDRSIKSYSVSHQYLLNYGRPQDDPTWCWAASLQCVLRAAGNELTQQEIHDHVFPGMSPSRANTNDIVDALAQITIADQDDEYSFRFLSLPRLGESQAPIPQRGFLSPELNLASVMNRGWFILAGSKDGHLMPVIDMHLDNAVGGPQISELITFDPASNGTKHFDRKQVLDMRYVAVRPVPKSSRAFKNRDRSASLIVPKGKQFDLVAQDGIVGSRPKVAATYYDAKQFQHILMDNDTTVFRAWVKPRFDMPWQLIDESGKSLRSVSAAKPFYEGLAAVRLGAKWGYVASDGSVKIPAKFDGAGAFSEDLAPIRRGDVWGFINREGTVTIPPRFRTVRPFSSQIAAVSTGKEYYFINRNGESIFDQRYLWAGDFGESLAPVKLPDDVNRGSADRYCFINQNGEIAAELGTFEQAHSFKAGLAAIRRGNCWGFITPDGRDIIPAQYSWVGDFNGLIAHVVDHFGRHRYIDRSGTKLPFSSEMVELLEGIDWAGPKCKVFLDSKPKGATVYMVPWYRWFAEANESMNVFLQNTRLRIDCLPNSSVTNTDCCVTEQFYAIVFVWPSSDNPNDPTQVSKYRIRIVDVRPGKDNKVIADLSSVE